MAEAIVNDSLDNKWHAFSAGTKPAGFVHPMAIQVLEEIGIHHNGRSKNVDEFKSMNFDLIVTVCNNAIQTCPVWLGSGSRLHLSFPDPAEVTGTEEFVKAAFRLVREDIIQRVPLVLRKATG